MEVIIEKVFWVYFVPYTSGAKKLMKGHFVVHDHNILSQLLFDINIINWYHWLR